MINTKKIKEIPLIAHFDGGPWDGMTWALEKMPDAIRPLKHQGEYLLLKTPPNVDVFYSWFSD